MSQRPAPAPDRQPLDENAVASVQTASSLRSASTPSWAPPCLAPCCATRRRHRHGARHLLRDRPSTDHDRGGVEVFRAPVQRPGPLTGPGRCLHALHGAAGGVAGRCRMSAGRTGECSRAEPVPGRHAGAARPAGPRCAGSAAGSPPFYRAWVRLPQGVEAGPRVTGRRRLGGAGSRCPARPAR